MVVGIGFQSENQNYPISSTCREYTIGFRSPWLRLLWKGRWTYAFIGPFLLRECMIEFRMPEKGALMKTEATSFIAYGETEAPRRK